MVRSAMLMHLRMRGLTAPAAEEVIDEVVRVRRGESFDAARLERNLIRAGVCPQRVRHLLAEEAIEYESQLPEEARVWMGSN